ncbi:MAG: WG repeat-containing protein [Rikenellaceae bacterium]|nr:WG repeat-containing protein [Rikenellaceae bacterium]
MTPSVNNYIETIISPNGRFKTIGNPVPERKRFEYPVLYHYGDFVDFPVSVKDKKYFIRCQLKREMINDLRNIEIVKYIKENYPDFLLSCSILTKEMYVFTGNGKGNYYDVLLTEIPEAKKLDTLLLKAILKKDSVQLRTFYRILGNLRDQLLSSSFRHNNIKPSNIYIDRKNIAKLHDYRFADIYCLSNKDIGYLDEIMKFIETGIKNPEKYKMISLETINNLEYLKTGNRDNYENKNYVSLVKESVLSYDPGNSSLSKPLCVGKIKEGFVIAKYNGKFGFITSEGNIGIPFIYDSVTDFEEGLAVVNRDGKFGVID